MDTSGPIITGPRKDTTMRAALLGALLAVAGTIFGVVLDHQITRRALDAFERRDMATRLTLRASARWVHARSVVEAADSSVFRRRWDDYMDEGFTQWNQEYYVLKHGVTKFFPDAEGDFGRLQKSFEDLHRALLPYHQSSGAPDRQTRDLARKRLDETGLLLQAWATKILATQ